MAKRQLKARFITNSCLFSWVIPWHSTWPLCHGRRDHDLVVQLPWSRGTMRILFSFIWVHTVRTTSFHLSVHPYTVYNLTLKLSNDNVVAHVLQSNQCLLGRVSLAFAWHTHPHKKVWIPIGFWSTWLKIWSLVLSRSVLYPGQMIVFLRVCGRKRDLLVQWTTNSEFFHLQSEVTLNTVKRRAQSNTGNVEHDRSLSRYSSIEYYKHWGPTSLKALWALDFGPETGMDGQFSELRLPTLRRNLHSILSIDPSKFRTLVTSCPTLTMKMPPKKNTGLTLGVR